MEKLYSSIEELNLMLALYPNQKKAILEEAGNKFKLDSEQYWFVVAENGECALFDKNCKIDDLSKVKYITNEMIREYIKKINIPDSVKSIGEYAFYYCESLKEVIFKGKTLDEVKIMHNYPWGIEDKSIIRCKP